MIFRHILKIKNALSWDTVVMIVFSKFPHYWVYSTLLFKCEQKLNKIQNNRNVSSFIRVTDMFDQIATGGK